MFKLLPAFLIVSLFVCPGASAQPNTYSDDTTSLGTWKWGASSETNTPDSRRDDEANTSWERLYEDRANENYDEQNQTDSTALRRLPGKVFRFFFQRGQGNND